MAGVGERRPLWRAPSWPWPVKLSTENVASQGSLRQVRQTGGGTKLTLPTNRRSLSPRMEPGALLNSRESYSLGNRCQFVAITIRNILSPADASQHGNRALCSGRDQKDFFPSLRWALNPSFALSPSITAHGCTIYRAYISCLFR